MMVVLRIFLILVCVLFIFDRESSFAANHRQQASPQDTPSKKKSHKWLIPIGIGAGFAIGTLAGLQAFDESINSDQKVWTTAILSAAAGGFAGWAVSRHLDKPSQTTFRWNNSPIHFDFQQVEPGCNKPDLNLTQQANCFFPSHSSSLSLQKN